MQMLPPRSTTQTKSSSVPGSKSCSSKPPPIQQTGTHRDLLYWAQSIDSLQIRNHSRLKLAMANMMGSLSVS
uniref:Uncharacterized protein n=1 Tax=Arundo donax TaxID=35708 RepID=A0A0A9B2R5_ARUDO